MDMKHQNEDDLDQEGIINRHPLDSGVQKLTWRTWLIGRPLLTADAPHQTIGKLVGLAVFGADALSSIAYAPQETLVILASAGSQAFGYAFPISLIITVLLAIVTISYQQTIHAYPGGGGAYTVVKENLGITSALIAGSALMLDYILLAAVAISSGVAQIVSAIPVLYEHRVVLAVGFLILIAIANLRGVKESGNTFAVPTYFFLGMTTLTVVIGFYKYLTGSLGVVVDPPHMETLGTQTVSLFLLLRAFSNGTTALTGVECISNGVKAFKEPRTQNASVTMIWMSTILGVLFVSMTFLLWKIGAVPAESETVVSQLARTVYESRGIFYGGTIIATTIILVLATNTAFADFPRLSAIIAEDGYLPRQLAFRGSRLVFSRGIVTLTAIAATLIILFQASVTALVPLWAVGVFLSFTLSQTGMAIHWRRAGVQGDKSWRWKLAINGVGACCTAIVTLIFAITKFSNGAWIIIILLPVIVMSFFAVYRHYRTLAQDLSLDSFGEPPHIGRHRVIMPVAGIHRGTLEALQYARSLSNDVTAVHILLDPAEREGFEKKWKWWGQGIRLVMIESPYRTFLEPFLGYVDEVSRNAQRNERLTIVVPQFNPRYSWHNLLHTQTALWLRFALLSKRGIVITEVPYQVH